MNNVIKNRYEISKVQIEDIWNLKIVDYSYELSGKDLVMSYLIPFPSQQALIILFSILKGDTSDVLIFESESDKIKLFETLISDLGVLMEEQDRRHGHRSELHFKIDTLDGGFESKVTPN
jgi:hypothetical protein